MVAAAAPSSTNNFTLSRGVIVCQDADLQGQVTVGSGTVLHPRCRIYALDGPIRIGENCIVEERAHIVNRKKDPLEVGDNNVFEVGCHIEAAAVGSSNTFEPKSTVASSIVVSDWCTIGAACNVRPTASLDDFMRLDDDPVPPGQKEILPSHTVVFGADCKRRIWSGEGKGQLHALHVKHLLYLREMLPRYNKLKQFAPGTATVAAERKASTTSQPAP